MSQIVNQTQDILNEKICSAVNRAIANGELPEAELPKFIIEQPTDKANGDFSTNILRKLKLQVRDLSTFTCRRNTIPQS